MYKLFLTFRYLTRKKIVVFPIMVVWLCVMMLIIVTSIMGGFVDRVRKANRELLGDIIISNRNAAGWPYYAELREKLLKDVPEVEEATPVVRTYGLLNFPEYNVTLPAQLVGIDPVGRAKVSRFRESLYRQYTSPKNAVDDLAPQLPATGEALTKEAKKKFEDANQALFEAQSNVYAYRDGKLGPRPLDMRWLIVAAVVAAAGLSILVIFWRKLAASSKAMLITLMIAVLGASTLLFLWPRLMPRDEEFLIDRKDQTIAQGERAYRTLMFAMSLDPAKKYATRQDLTDALVPKNPSFEIPQTIKERLNERDQKRIQHGCIIGVHVGLYPRDQRGNFVRAPEREYLRSILTIVPVTRRGTIMTDAASSRTFMSIDDSYTGVYDVDSTYVYAPLEVVQEMGLMAAAGTPGTPEYSPAHCNELQIKLKGSPDARDMRRIREKIEEVTQKFFSTTDYPFGGIDVQTWDQRQAKYLNAVQNEKRMQIFILGLMSGVVLVVIFLIFYMIVRDKTRDIGIIKALGGSEEGVAAIFVLYGLFIGAVGGALGVTSGVAFVLHTNEIHEWLYQVFGIMIWDRSVYLFDRIPDQVDYLWVTIFYVAALISGVLGALIPAIFAGAKNPVEAVRFE